MAVLKCKMCGGTMEMTNESVAVCEFCGTKQTVPKLDNDRKNNLYDRANHFRRNNEYDKAMAIFENILNEDNTDAESYWSLVLCKYGIEYVKDPVSGKRVPTVNRAQFTSVFADENYKSAIKYADSNQRSIYEAEAKSIDEIQKGILAISQKEKPFDVFICYKETDASGSRTKDSVIATELYHELTKEGFKVFFSRITLEDKLGTAYEPYIFAALNSSKVMVVIGTKAEYLNAVWVKNEWSRYLTLIKNGETKMLIPAYRDMDPYDLPEEFSHLQAQDMSKLGFMQDLIRGIKKITAVDEPAPATVVKETIVQQAGGNATVDSLLKRMFIFLEDKDFASANEYAEKVLDIDPENAQAYLGKVLAMLKKSDLSGIGKSDVDLSEDKNFERAIRYSTGEDKAKLGEIKERNKIEVKFLKEATVENGILKEYIGSEKEIYIPSSIKSIDNYAFFDCSTIVSVTIPDSVTSIGDSAFYGCKSLASVTIPDSVASIGNGAFSGCESLTSVTIPECVTSIGSGAFIGCDSLAEIIVYGDNFRFTDNCLIDIKQKRLIYGFDNATIPQDGSVTSIGESAFWGCKSLASVTIPESVTSIGEWAFGGCESLASVTIPECVTSIGSGAFGGCFSLTDIVIYGDNFRFADNCLIDVKQKKLIYGFNNAKIPQDGSVTSIGDSAFSGCKSLASVTIPDSVTSIGDRAFSYCESLASITIPDSVTSIGDRAFNGCESLVSVTIPDSVTSIGERTFYGCESLVSVIIPDSVTSIGDWAFSGCESLASVTIPDSVTSIGNWGAFDSNAVIYANEGSYALAWARQNNYQNRNLTEQEAKRRAKELQNMMAFRRELGVCQHCGGDFKGLFTKKCISCGKTKDY